MAAPTPTATHQKVVATLLSPARLAPYLRATNGNLRAALKLYQWNVEMSAAVYKMLHLVEVFLRNAIDAELRIWNTTQTNPVTGRQHRPSTHHARRRPGSAHVRHVAFSAAEQEGPWSPAVVARGDISSLPQHGPRGL